jgi:hypothetical protein
LLSAPPQECTKCKKGQTGVFGSGTPLFLRLLNAVALMRLIPAALRVAQKATFLKP